MPASEKTRLLIDNINEYSQKPLKNNYEVSVIIESTLNENNTDLFKELIFTAKYVNGLKSVLSNQIVNKDDFMERMFEEFNKNVQKFSEGLRLLIDSNNDKVKDHFKVKYFELNHENLVQTMELIEDLTICKEFFNRKPEYLDNLQESGKTS